MHTFILLSLFKISLLFSLVMKTNNQIISASPVVDADVTVLMWNKPHKLVTRAALAWVCHIPQRLLL